MPESVEATSTERRFVVSLDVQVEVVVRDSDVIERITGPGGDEWRRQFYGSIKDGVDVAEHLALNAVRHGIGHARQLEGWGDIDSSAATMSITEAEPFDTRERDLDGGLA